MYGSSEGDMSATLSPMFTDIFSSEAPMPTKRMLAKPGWGPERATEPQDVPGQLLLEKRLQGITPVDFHPEGVAIYLTSDMRIPRDWEHVTFHITSSRCEGDLPVEEQGLLHAVRAVLVICDISNSKEVELAKRLNCTISRLPFMPPPSVLVPHVARDPHSTVDADKEFELLSGAMDDGFDCTIVGQPEGMRLACQVHSELMSQDVHVGVMRSALKIHCDQVERWCELQEQVDMTVWDYCRVRLYMPIPPVDHSFRFCQGEDFAGFRVRDQLGEGGSGKVYMLTDPKENAVPQVVKAVEKAPRTTMSALKILGNEIKAMELLSEKWEHPNIIKLHQVYHSETHIYLRMQYGGKADLFKYLMNRANDGLALEQAQARSIIAQCGAALCHLHLGPKVVHRDIKPENVIINETDQGITAMLCDFDMARIEPKDRLSQFVGGTFPFMAPEIFQKRPYSPFPIDIWSMGMLYLEVTCCLGIILKVLNLPRVRVDDPQKGEKQLSMMGMIMTFFTQTGNAKFVMSKNHGQDLGSLVNGAVGEMIEGMLIVEASQRMQAADLQERIESC
jgi:hypothetical protein